MVLGVRVHGDSVRDVEVTLDETFRMVPVPNMLGIPVMWKRKPGTGGDDSDIKSNIIVKLMADPDTGFAPMDWQYGGSVGPAPPVLLARKDKLPFSTHDWDVVYDYMGHWRDEFATDEPNPTEIAEKWLKPSALRQFIQRGLQSDEHLRLACLSLQFPLGSIVELHGMAAQDLNGSQGEVVQYSRDRVGIQLPGRPVTAVKPERLRLLKDAEALGAPDKQQRCSGTSEAEEAAKRAEKAARQVAVANKEARLIAKRFAECMHEDVFPEPDDQPLFGLGGEYRQRAQDVLAVWQGAVKSGELTEEDLAAALAEDRVKALFEATCKKTASARMGSATYAQTLLDNKFAGVEWESM